MHSLVATHTTFTGKGISASRASLAPANQFHCAWNHQGPGVYPQNTSTRCAAPCISLWSVQASPQTLPLFPQKLLCSPRRHGCPTSGGPAVHRRLLAPADLHGRRIWRPFPRLCCQPRCHTQGTPQVPQRTPHSAVLPCEGAPWVRRLEAGESGEEFELEGGKGGEEGEDEAAGGWWGCSGAVERSCLRPCPKGPVQRQGSASKGREQ